MTLTLKQFLAAAGAALALAAAGASADAASARREANGAIRYYDDNGFDRGYAWCLRRGGRDFSGWADCSYFSFEQCRASAVGPIIGSCEPNPFSFYVQAPQGKPRRR